MVAHLTIGDATVRITRHGRPWFHDDSHALICQQQKLQRRARLGLPSEAHFDMTRFTCGYEIGEGMTMAARDRYSRKLECGQCGHAGFAEVSEDDDPRRKTRGFQIDALPRGFETEFASSNPVKHMMRCQCGHKFRFEQATAYAPGGEPRR